MQTKLAQTVSAETDDVEPALVAPVSDAGTEQRWARRTNTRLGAQIAHPSLTQPLLCTVRDMSSTGARLEVASNRGAISRDRVPDHFTLMMPTERTMVECRVAWRQGALVGVRYTSPTRRMAKPERKIVPEVKKPGAKLLSMLLNPV
ncbi:MAG: PilZ domain-containing protein [Hyphomicrobium sp.]|nr:PilZ domain-containing protein [Hyphomicrobium sp.]